MAVTKIDNTPYTLKLINGDELIGGRITDGVDADHIRLSFPQYLIQENLQPTFCPYISTSKNYYTDIKKDKIVYSANSIPGYATRYNSWIGGGVLGNMVDLSLEDRRGYTKLKAWQSGDDFEEGSEAIFGKKIYTNAQMEEFLAMGLKSLKLMGGEEVICEYVSYDAASGNHTVDFPTYCIISEDSGYSYGTYIDSVFQKGITINDDIIASVYDTDLAYAESFGEFKKMLENIGYDGSGGVGAQSEFAAS